MQLLELDERETIKHSRYIIAAKNLSSYGNEGILHTIKRTRTGAAPSDDV